MKADDAPTIVLNLQPYALMQTAVITLELLEYSNFREFVETEKIDEATELLQDLKSQLGKLDNPDLLEIKEELDNESYYAAVDEQMDRFREVSRLLDEWEVFLASDDALAVLSNYAAEKLREFTGSQVD